MILVFVATGVVVYWIGQSFSSQAGRFTATATVYAPDRPGLSAESIQSEILVDSEGRTREDVRVSSDLAAASGRWRTAISNTGSDAESATRLVNDLAERFAASQRAIEAARLRPSRSEPAVDAAQADLQRARGELDHFLREHFAHLRQRADRLHQGEAASSSLSAAAGTPETQTTGMPTIENPRWVELNNRIAQMEQQRAELLLSRTAMHPSVKDMDGELAGLGKQLAGIARRTAAGENARPERSMAAEPPATGLPAGADLQPILQEDKVAVRRYAELRQAADQAEQKHQQAADAARRTQPVPAAIPTVDVQLAERSERPESKVPQHLFLAALLAGLAMASGVSMISYGIAEPPLSTVSEIQAALPVPVVGVISTNGAETTQAAQTLLQGLGRPALIVGGLTLVVVCMGAVAMFVR